MKYPRRKDTYQSMKPPWALGESGLVRPVLEGAVSAQERMARKQGTLSHGACAGIMASPQSRNKSLHHSYRASCKAQWEHSGKQLGQACQELHTRGVNQARPQTTRQSTNSMVLGAVPWKIQTLHKNARHGRKLLTRIACLGVLAFLHVPGTARQRHHACAFSTG